VIGQNTDFYEGVNPMKKSIVASALSVMVMLSVSALAASTPAKTDANAQPAAASHVTAPAKKAMSTKHVKHHVAKASSSSKTMVSKTTPKMTSVASTKTSTKATTAEKTSAKTTKH
jgi:hypothetical protein